MKLPIHTTFWRDEHPRNRNNFELQGTVLFSGFDTENHMRVFATRVQFQQAQFHWELG